MCCPTNFFLLGLRGSRQSWWGGAEKVLSFGGRVSLEGSSSSDSRAELSSEDNDGIIGCSGLRCIFRA